MVDNPEKMEAYKGKEEAKIDTAINDIQERMEVMTDTGQA
jgi:hypothetical protein